MALALVAALHTQRRAHPDAPVAAPILCMDTEKQGCWPTSRAAWVLGAGTGVSHVLVIQDDAVLADDFVAGATNALRARPADPVCFYSARKEVPAAVAKGRPWVSFGGSSWLNAQAVALPADLAVAFVAWAAQHEAEQGARWGKSYDTRLAAFLVAHKRPMWVTAPSLVDHADVPSQMGHPRTTGGRPRRAALFQAHDTRYIDWSVTL